MAAAPDGGEYARDGGARSLAVALSLDASERQAHFIPWSMRQERANLESDRMLRHDDISCIVCFENQGAADVDDWYACRTCSAAWCDQCMAQMYNAARDHEEEVDLTCPQCRGSISDMQLQCRLNRITAADGLGCSEEQAQEVVAYENLLTELVHLCECDESGLPYFTMPAATVARVMARDEICEVVEAKQGAATGSRLRRMMRAADYPSAFALALQGFAAVLRASRNVPRASALVEELVADLAAMVRGGCARVAGMVVDARRVLEAERASECATVAAAARARPRGRTPHAQRSLPGSRQGSRLAGGQAQAAQAALVTQVRATTRGVRKAPRR